MLEVLTLKTSALKLFTVANLHQIILNFIQLRWMKVASYNSSHLNCYKICKSSYDKIIIWK